MTARLSEPEGPCPCCGRPSCERLEREHRRRDLTGGRIGDRGRGPFEDEQPRTRDLARKRFAVADREERVAATWATDRKSTRLNSSHMSEYRMPSSA